MGKIFLVRHGQDTDNVKRVLNGHRNTELSPLGREQAVFTAKKFIGKNVSVIYSSPLFRAIQTALLTAYYAGCRILIINKALIERDFGILTGLPISEIPLYATKTISTKKGVFCLEGPGVETFEEVFVRAKNFLEEIKKKHHQENIVVVTHGDTGKMLMAAHYGWSVECSLTKPYLQNAEMVELL